MAMFSPVDPADLRRDLSGALHTFSAEADGTLSGVCAFGQTLVGPPGRLHGGLHAYARLLPVLDALPQPPQAPPVRLRLSLLKALPLDQDCAFTGRYRAGDDWRLETRFLDTDRLSAVAEPAGPVPEGLLERFAALRGDDEHQFEILTAGTVPMQVGSRLVSVGAAYPAGLDTGSAMNRFLAPGGAGDAPWVCCVLDLLAAVVQGVAWRSHVLTVKIDITLATAAVEGPVLLLGDRRSRPDGTVSLRPLVVDGEARGPMVVSVLLTEPGLQRAYAWGEITLHPARKRLV